MAIMRVKLQQQVVQITENRKSNYLAGSGVKKSMSLGRLMTKLMSGEKNKATNKDLESDQN